MSRISGVQLLVALGLLIIVAAGVTVLSDHSSEAQPGFRDFDPPKNPVTSDVSHDFDFPGEVASETRRTQLDAGTPYSEYVRLFDEHETVSLMIPASWNDVELGHATADDHEGVARIMASSDLVAYESTAAPGVTVVATSKAMDEGDALDTLDQNADAVSTACGKGRLERFEYADPFYSGNYDFYADCGNGYGQIVLAAASATNDVEVLISAVVQNEADLEAVEKIMASFQVLGEPGEDEHHEHEHEH